MIATALNLTFVDLDATVAEALRTAFARFPAVVVSHGDLISVAENTVVSPANGEGLMDGGIDAAYSAALPGVEQLVRDAIARRPEGFLPVGGAVLVPVSHARIEYVLAAATMLAPEAVDAQNAYRALRAVLRIADAHPARVRALYCPGLCTGIGQVEPAAAATAMAAAYGDWLAAKGI